LAIVVSLLRWQPKGPSAANIRQLFVRATCVLVGWLAVGVPAAFAMGSYTETILSDAGEIIGDGNVVVLKPETWIGKRFPLLEYIDIGDRLKEGKWLVLFNHHDCPKCREVIQDLARITRELGVQQVALIEMRASGKSASVWDSPRMTLTHGRLSGTTEWFAEAPLASLLDNGIVLRVHKRGSWFDK
jgi:hypothetical protein